MRKVMLLMYVFAATSCTKDITAPVVPQIKKQEEYLPPYTHPKFVRDTTWIEGNVGMDFWPSVTEWTLDLKPWSYQIVTDTNDAVRKGWKSQRFEVRFGDCVNTDCNRGPVWERREFGEGTTTAKEGQEYWYGWSFYVPNENRNSLNWAYIGQFQQSPSNSAIWMFLKREGRGFCLLFEPSKNANHDCFKNTSYELIPDHLFMGRWHDIVVHASWKKDSSGVFQVWVNGELKVDYNGYTMAKETVGVPFKYGIYRQTDNNTSVVYFDEIRRGNRREEVDIRLLEK